MAASIVSVTPGLSSDAGSIAFNNVVVNEGSVLILAVNYVHGGSGTKVDPVISGITFDAMFVATTTADNGGYGGEARIYVLNFTSQGTVSFTVTLPGEDYTWAALMVVDGILPVDKSSLTGAGTGTAMSAGPLTPGFTDAFVVALAMAQTNNNSTTISTPTGFTRAASETRGSTYCAGALDYRNMTAAVPVTANWTLSPSAQWNSVMLVFRTLGDSPAASTSNGMMQFFG